MKYSELKRLMKQKRLLQTKRGGKSRNMVQPYK